MTYINEKKLELSKENPNQILFSGDQKIVNQMLHGLLIFKIKNYGIDLSDLNNFVKTLNSRINFSEEIPEKEYNFSYIISNKYSKNLKIRMPIFEPMDAFYFIYSYEKENKYKLGEIFNDINYSTFGELKNIPREILTRKDYNNMKEL